MIRTLVAGLLLMSTMSFAAGDALHLKAPEIVLWPNGAPGSEGVTAQEEWLPSTDGFHRVKNIHNPTITVFLPPKERSTGAAFVVCPGGAHKYLVMDLEGANVAARLNGMGVAAFVLKSRLAQSEGYNYKVEIHSLRDAQRAIRLIRSRAKEWGIDSARVGIMGFSAGGAIAALGETRFDRGNTDATDPVDRFNSRPDFAVLGYPGLRNIHPDVSNETPPTFMVVNNDDSLAKETAEYYIALKKAGVAAELHIYDKGGHGFGMTGRTPAFQQLSVASWPDRLHDWMVGMGYLDTSAA